MPQPRIPLPHALGPTFSVEAARQHGVKRGRLRSPTLEAPFYGIRRLADTTTPVDDNERVRLWAQAYQPRMREDDMYSHEAAARLLSAPLPLGADASLHVTTIRPRRATQARGVVAHSIDARAAQSIMLDGMRVASPALTWAMLGESLDVPWLVVLGDYFCRVWRSDGYYRPDAGKEPLAHLSDLSAMLHSMRWRGGARLRLALPLIRLDSWSPMESLVRFHLVAGALPEPELNRDVYDRNGVHLGCLDMSYPELKVAVEYQGQAHGRQYARDIERVERLRAEGWIVVQVSSELLRNPALLVTRVRAALVARGWNR